MSLQVSSKNPPAGPSLGKLNQLPPVGKLVGQHRYLHVCLLNEQDAELAKLTELLAAQAGVAKGEFNVVRYRSDGGEVTFLNYESFDEAAFPRLLGSVRYEPNSRKIARTDFSKSTNPPILHRKELLLPKSCARYREFVALTETLQTWGAFKDSNKIGHKLQWEERLVELGIQILDHVATKNRPKATSRGPTGALRHLTAISRNSLSVPMRALAVGGLLERDASVFDYGCGRGDDVRILVDAGIDAHGWDPFFAPATRRQKSDVVNLGFVLNVIENEEERNLALREAWSLADKVLCVGVMLRTQSESGEHETFTARGTFQKYFTQSELKTYVASVTAREPISAAPGVVLAFRTDADEQAYLLRRQIGLDDGDGTLEPLLSSKEGDGRIGLHHDLLDAYWRHCLRRARILKEDEHPPALEIGRLFGSPRKALRLFVGAEFEQKLLRAADQRKEEILLWLALNQFERRRSSSVWPYEIRKDVNRLFGKQGAAVKLATDLLFSLGEARQWIADFRLAEAGGKGFLDEDGDYMFLSDRLREQPLKVRLLVGCAERVISPGEVHELTRINSFRRRVSWLHFDRFDHDAFPPLSQRIRVDLGKADAEIINYSTLKDKPVLVMKSMLFGSSGFPQTAAEALVRSGLGVPRPTFHFRASEIRRRLTRALG